jgi:leucyl aminopeptidase
MKLQLCLPTLAVLLASTLGSSLAKPIATAEIKAKSALGFNLLTFAEGAEPVWKSTAETDALIAEGARFVSLSLPYSPEFSDCNLCDRLT